MSTNTPTPDTAADTPAAPAGAPPANTARPAGRSAKTVKIMAVLIAVLFAAACALGAFILTRQLGASPLAAVGATGATFLGVSGTALYIQEKLGLL
ncbi:hypothetical protein ACFW6V_14265 [Streptomyces sp. NPDC058734]|uniref:hypothetical protein n=1 Tax=Streptomyces sp. NPDC058734 TaxID=3346615 RepID=UPI0036B639A5